MSLPFLSSFILVNQIGGRGASIAQSRSHSNLEHKKKASKLPIPKYQSIAKEAGILFLPYSPQKIIISNFSSSAAQVI